MKILTRSGVQCGDIAFKSIRERLDLKDVFDTWHQVTNQQSHWSGTVVVHADVTSHYVTGIHRFPPADHVDLDFTLWSRPFQSHIVRVDKRGNIGHWTGSFKKSNIRIEHSDN